MLPPEIECGMTRSEGQSRFLLESNQHAVFMQERLRGGANTAASSGPENKRNMRPRANHEIQGKFFSPWS